MPEIEERIGKNGKKTYRARVRVKGCPTQTATFDRKTDAKNWREKTRADIRAGRHMPFIAAKKHTLAELIEKYVEEVLPNKKPGSRKKN